MIDYHWPCRVQLDETGKYRVCPVGMVGCDGDGETREEAAAKAQKALQAYLASRNIEALLAIGLYQHNDMDSLIAGELIRVRVDLPT